MVVESMRKASVDQPWKTFQLDPFNPPWWLQSGHLQTVYYTSIVKRPAIEYRRERWEVPDGDFIDMDFVDGNPDAPVILAEHGLEGDSNSGYILRLMKRVKELGWNGVVQNQRGCSGELNRLARSYHSGATEDVDYVVKQLLKRFQYNRFYITGYSLGGNMVAKWLSNQAEDIHPNFRGAAICSAPLDIHAAQKHVDRGLNRFYGWSFLWSMRQKALEKAKHFPKDIKSMQVLSSFSFLSYDNAYTAKVHGFKDALDYYQQASALPHIKKIAVPTLLVHSYDDPLIPDEAVPHDDQINHETTLFLATRQGGHVGFYDQKQKSFWLVNQLMRWFKLLEESGSNS